MKAIELTIGTTKANFIGNYCPSSEATLVRSSILVPTDTDLAEAILLTELFDCNEQSLILVFIPRSLLETTAHFVHPAFTTIFVRPTWELGGDAVPVFDVACRFCVSEFILAPAGNRCTARCGVQQAVGGGVSDRGD